VLLVRNKSTRQTNTDRILLRCQKSITRRGGVTRPFFYVTRLGRTRFTAFMNSDEDPLTFGGEGGGLDPYICSSKCVMLMEQLITTLFEMVLR
jgi:hypothetical protein